MGRHMGRRHRSASGGRARGRRDHGRGHVRRNSAGTWAIAVVILVCASFGGGAAFAYWQETRDGAVADRALPAADPSVAPARSPLDASPSGTPGAGASASPRPSSSAPRPSASGDVAIPATGPGTFRTASADVPAAGRGSRLWRYKVLVEDGIDIGANQAAAEVAAILADDRGWTRGGSHSFRLVSSGPYDFVVKIAAPGTVDRVCGAAGLLTRGEVNCRVGEDVVVNLKRWMLGSPEFDGPIGDYRALIVNHEVGHRLGRGHEGCPGPGEPAPAMMQQIKGLQGCVANAWPYDRDGGYVGGPAVR
ncbi:DUF3152 domain-containing protein [Streptomyces sp. HNM0645]|uniref:DUF3152 domain-containing protein n=1 Tax=Streptomyces sp. HNM0645 TaxID=2782343 RepID=UPI0024B71384|nr:DUF3152 domain-containing protein [Streptomyces sp. HNM0645]MDI9887834.1 DUF3152 domain-containing protein [Streptomyces sp. HNM0645]